MSNDLCTCPPIVIVDGPEDSGGPEVAQPLWDSQCPQHGVAKIPSIPQPDRSRYWGEDWIKRIEAIEAKLFPPPSLVSEQDIRIDIYRIAVPGAPCSLRMTHIPTGIVVTAEGGRSQLRNKADALEQLEAKLRAKGWTRD